MSSYHITYLDYNNDEHSMNVEAYTVKQAVYVFYKMVQYTVQEILNIVRC